MLHVHAKIESKDDLHSHTHVQVALFTVAKMETTQGAHFN